MNEIELLRTQLAAERKHVREVASGCAAAFGAEPPVPAAASEALRRACLEYLGCVLGWFDERDARLGELCARLPAADADPAAVVALGSGGRGREALERLTADGGAREDWLALAQFINGPWDQRRGAVEALLGGNPRVTDWRAFAGIDADSICRERALHARCRAALPGPA